MPGGDLLWVILRENEACCCCPVRCGAKWRTRGEMKVREEPEVGTCDGQRHSMDVSLRDAVRAPGRDVQR